MSGHQSQHRSLQDELHANYVDERDIEAFAHALSTDELFENDYLDSPSSSHASLHRSVSSRLGTPKSNGHQTPRIRKVSALSDFAPVHLKVKRRQKGIKPHEKRQEWLFLILRWPLLLFIFLFICFEFSLYIFIRQCVNAKEWFTAWRGRKGVLRKRLRAAHTYEEWKAAALTLDDFLKFDEWKMVDEDPLYDWRLVRKVLKSLRVLREKDDARGVLGVLETCIRTNFAGVESSRLYSETFLGTKKLIESYVAEVEKCLIYIRDSTVLSKEEKRRFFKSSNTNLGVSALCLSGGASFGYYHFGVLKAFVQAKLLPRVITGTSAGAVVAALACTRTDAELERLLVPEVADNITACEEPFRVWFKRFWKTGARFDSVTWARKACFFTRGSLTFREAYLRTGRILNVSVVPADRHSPTKLLNYMTAPNTVIWSALIASAAVPGILNPVVLMQKTRDGSIIPWNWGSKFKDGSLRVDIPLQALNLYFNVTHPVVSQVNPHVHLFFFAPRGSAGKPVAHRKGKGWRGNFLLSAAEQWLKLELTKNFKFIRDLELLPQLLGQDWSSVFLQRFDGTVTIWPKTRFMDWVHILSDPDRQELERMMLVGQAVAWPKLHMIENRFRLEREIFRGRQAVRRTPTKSPLTRDRLPLPIDDRTLLEDGTLRQLISLHLPTTSASTAPTVSDALLADTDTDTENDIANTAQRVRRGWRHVASGSSTPRDLKSSEDPLRSPARRRRWASQIFDDPELDARGPRAGTPDPPPEASLMQFPPLASPYDGHTPPTPRPEASGSGSGFLARLRTTSFQNFTSPFSTIRGARGLQSRESLAAADDAGMWSSDSSSEDELPMNGLGRGGFLSRRSSSYFPSNGWSAHGSKGSSRSGLSGDGEDGEEDLKTPEAR